MIEQILFFKNLVHTTAFATLANPFPTNITEVSLTSGFLLIGYRFQIVIILIENNSISNVTMNGVIH